jgi:hypothetical protein
VLHVDATNGDDASDGSSGAPLRTVQRALALSRPGTTVRLSGVFYEAVETAQAGLADNPIVIEAAPGGQAVIDGNGELDAPRLIHSYVTLRGVEVRNTKEGVRIEGAQGVVVANNHIHHVENECLRLRYFARDNRVESNVISDCGLDGNGEGIYVGTAPEQREKNGGLPDESSGNYIAANEIHSVEEGIDVKEDSWGTIVAGNLVHGATDDNSGGINVRGDDNFIVDNRSRNNAGAGFRFGGDVTDSPRHGPGHHYGTGNLLRGNLAVANAAHGFKFMHGPQTADCTNGGEGNSGQLFYFDDAVQPFLSCP